jgi:glutathionyl-hydroquinone reductase
VSVRTDFWKGVPGGVDSDDSGRFVRRDSIFRRWVSNDAGAEFPAEPGRYHLYVSLGCPWASRAVTVRALKGLEEVVGLSVVDPVRDIKGWAFREARSTASSIYRRPMSAPTPATTTATAFPSSGTARPARSSTASRPRSS